MKGSYEKPYIKGIKNNNQIEFETIKRIRNNFKIQVLGSLGLGSKSSFYDT